MPLSTRDVLTYWYDWYDHIFRVSISVLAEFQRILVALKRHLVLGVSLAKSCFI